MFHKRRFIGVYDYTVILTYVSLLSAIVGMTKAVEGAFTFAVICLFVSGICDAFDGVVARTKKDRTEAEKEFGIQIDSLCDVVCFGVYPAFLCYFIGVDGAFGTIVVFMYCLCAVIRLGFFNVLESSRQKQEDGCAKSYRGLPVTSISLILPAVYCLHPYMSDQAFDTVMLVLMVLVAFLFIYDFAVPKPDWKKILRLPI